VYRLRYGVCYIVIFENEERYHVEKCGPDNRLEGRKYLSGYNGGYGIGGVMKAIDIVED
jgi:hypothetical protein